MLAALELMAGSLKLFASLRFARLCGRGADKSVAKLLFLVAPSV